MSIRNFVNMPKYVKQVLCKKSLYKKYVKILRLQNFVVHNIFILFSNKGYRFQI